MIDRFAPQSLRRWMRDRRGVSATEFALVSPILVFLFFGCVELSLLMQVDRKTTAAAATLGDLVSRGTVINDDELDDIFAATELLMSPYPAKKLRLRVSSIVEDEDEVRVAWSDVYTRTGSNDDETTELAASNWSPRAEDSLVDVPDGIITTGGSLVFAEVEYDYEPEFSFVLSNNIVKSVEPGVQRLAESFYIRPRRVEQVERDDS